MQEKLESNPYKLHKDSVSSEQIAGLATDADFASKPHQLIATGRNFGHGPGAETAVNTLKGAGVKLVIAKSFARPFFRAAINLGLPVLMLKDAYKLEGRTAVYLQNGEIVMPGEVIRFPPYTGVVKEILDAGGLVNYIITKRAK